MNTKKQILTTISACSFMLIASQAVAETITWNNDYRIDGGEFTIAGINTMSSPLTLGGYIDGKTKNVVGTPDSFQTFCIERNQYVGLNQTINVQLNAGASPGGFAGANADGIDIVSLGTGFLYKTFASGAAEAADWYDYDIAPGDRRNKADELQDTIWLLEQEFGLVDLSSINKYVSDDLQTAIYNEFAQDNDSMLQAFNRAMADQDMNNNYQVFALNLTLPNGTERQDQLYYAGNPSNIAEPTPDTGNSLLLLGVAFGSIGFFQKRLRK